MMRLLVGVFVVLHQLSLFWMVAMGTIRGEVEELQHRGRILVVAGQGWKVPVCFDGFQK